MGYSRHHAIIVTACDEQAIAKAHAKAKTVFGDSVTEILLPAINGYRTFFIGPDGSKEWWADSDAGDKRRAEYSGWLKACGHWFYAAEVQYHDEENSLWIKGIPDLKEDV